MLVGRTAYSWIGMDSDLNQKRCREERRTLERFLNRAGAREGLTSAPQADESEVGGFPGICFA